MPKILDENWKNKEDREELECIECRNSFAKSMFSPRGKTTAGNQKYDPRCRPCSKAFGRANFDSVKKWEKFRQIVDDAKVKCEICGYSKYKGSLDFHHRDPATKVAEISDMIYWGSKSSKGVTEEILQAEIDKCAVICSNCHREVHAGVTNID